jgi:DNA-binding transcriptional MerR regulator
MAQALKKHAVPETPVIPDRLYFKIGDVARICGVETYVLRFWETQFPQLKPNKSGTGQRLYRRREVELALEIKRLVHAEGYTIAGAKHVLDTAPRQAVRTVAAAPAPKVQVVTSAPQAAAPANEGVKATIGHARAELRELMTMLSNSDPAIGLSMPRPKAKILRVRQESEPLFPL